ncbi:MAG: DMT family transporter [Bacillota bacterium]
MSKKLRGELMLLLTALIWGASFVAQRAGMAYIGPFTFNGIRSYIGALTLLPLIIAMDRREQKTGRNADSDSAQCRWAERRVSLTGGIWCGIILFVASSLQQYGMLYTTAGKAGFITALYIVLVPLLGLFLKRRVRPLVWLCVALATIGLYLLSVEEGLSIGKGDWLVMACAVGFAVHILVIDHFSPHVNGVKLSCLQFFVCGLLSTPFMLAFETIDWAGIVSSWLPILYAGIMSCGVAYTLQIIAQRDTDPTIASIILSLESVFALLTGIAILSEQVTARQAAGCATMLTATILAQLPSREGRRAAT